MTMRKKKKNLDLHFPSTYPYQTWQGVDLGEEQTNHQVNFYKQVVVTVSLQMTCLGHQHLSE